MLIYTSSLRCNRGDCAPPESRQYVRRHECKTPENRQYGAKSSRDMTGRIRVDRRRGIYVHETDKKNINELKRTKVDRRSRNRRRVDRRQAGVASKDQIQQVAVLIDRDDYNCWSCCIRV